MSVTFPAGSLDTTLSNIVEQALLELGVISVGDTIDTDTMTQAVYRFNSLVLSLDVPLHAEDEQSFVTTGSNNYISADYTTKILSFGDKDIEEVSRYYYDYYVNNGTAVGTKVFIDYGDSPPTIRFINEPDAATVTYRRKRLPAILTSTDKPVYPLDATEMLILGLAYKLAPSFGISTEKRMELRSDFREAKDKFRLKQVRREGDEIVAPPMVV